MRTPRATRLDQPDAHRLIASKYRPGGESVLVGIADDDAHLHAIFELDDATNDRLLAEADRLPGIGGDELVFGVPHYRVINAACCHAHPEGGRFNGPDRGAWSGSAALASPGRQCPPALDLAFHLGGRSDAFGGCGDGPLTRRRSCARLWPCGSSPAAGAAASS